MTRSSRETKSLIAFENVVGGLGWQSRLAEGLMLVEDPVVRKGFNGLGVPRHPEGSEVA